MKASETQFQKVIEGTNQFIVPHFQRPYTWEERQWMILWEDIEELLDSESDPAKDPPRLRHHFLGSIVTMPGHSVPEGITKYVLIDGQQRLTTLLLLLAALRDVARQRSIPRLPDEIHDLYLTNRHRDGQETFKLLPTEGDTTEGVSHTNNDQATFIAIIDNREHDPKQPVALSYRYFHEKLDACEDGRLNDIKQIVISRLLLVSIVLDHGDDPYAIFESLNAKGLPLSQADLIRNYCFMRIHVDRHREIFAKVWKPMEQKVGVDNLPEFFRHYLMRDGGVIKNNEVYYHLKSRVDGQAESEFERTMDELARFSDFYARLLDPQKEHEPTLQERLGRLNRIEASVAYPFLLRLYADWSAGQVSVREFEEILDVIDNFLIRRFVCSIGRSELNKLFPELYRLAKRHGSLVHGVKAVLASRHYPTDDECRDSLVKLKRYAGGDRRGHAHYILSRLEASFDHHEQVDLNVLTIEHVMPQTLSEEWRSVMGPEADMEHERWVHTLGNLTLSAYNAEMSNAPFPKKQEIYGASHIEMNRYFHDKARWDCIAIEQRGLELTRLALKIWPHFAPAEATDATVRSRVRGKAPSCVHILGRRHEVRSWQEVLKITLEQIGSELSPEVLTELSREKPHLLGKRRDRFRSPKQLDEEFWYEGNLSADAIAEFCKEVAIRAGVGREDYRFDIASSSEQQGTEPI